MSGASFAALAAARWIHFASVMLLFGASFFPFYALPPHDRFPALGEFARAEDGLLRFAAVIALVSGLAWAAASLVSMTGSFAALFQADAVAAFLFETGFGKVWLVRLVLMVAIAATVLVGQSLSARAFAAALVALLAALLLVSQAWIGHPAASTGGERIVVVAAYGLHVLGAGAWFGGLLPLWLLLREPAARSGAGDRLCTFALLRFSAVGMVAVAAILLGGFVNAWARWDSLNSFVASAWGEVLIAKVLAFVGLLVLAGANRFVLMPRMSSGTPVLKRLACNVLVEQAGGLAILAGAAILGILAPPA